MRMPLALFLTDPRGKSRIFATSVKLGSGRSPDLSPSSGACLHYVYLYVCVYFPAIIAIRDVYLRIYPV